MRTNRMRRIHSPGFLSLGCLKKARNRIRTGTTLCSYASTHALHSNRNSCKATTERTRRSTLAGTLIAQFLNNKTTEVIRKRANEKLSAVNGSSIYRVPSRNSVTSREEKSSKKTYPYSSLDLFSKKKTPIRQLTLRRKILLSKKIPLKPIATKKVVEFVRNVDSKYSGIYREIGIENYGFIDRDDLYRYVRLIGFAYNKYSTLEPWKEEDSMREHEKTQIFSTVKLIMKIFDVNKNGVIREDEFLAVCSIFFHYFPNQMIDFKNSVSLNALSFKVKAAIDYLSKPDEEDLGIIQEMSRQLDTEVLEWSSSTGMVKLLRVFPLIFHNSPN